MGNEMNHDEKSPGEGEPAPPPSTPAQHYLAATNGCASQDWQDGFNAAAALAVRGDLIPSNWCDPLLTGPTAALHGDPGTWSCPDIERLLNGIRKRIAAPQPQEEA